MFNFLFKSPEQKAREERQQFEEWKREQEAKEQWDRDNFRGSPRDWPAALHTLLFDTRWSDLLP
jgi:hypothetical protein